MSDFSQKRDAILDQLRALGVVRVEIRYSGSGDSGAVDEVHAYMAAAPDDPVHPNDVLPKTPEGVAIRVGNKLLGRDTGLYRELEEFAYDALNEANVDDWVNNDGGEGSIEIDLTADPEQLESPIKIHHRIFITETQDTEYEL